jgi:hypothetical protein
MDIGEPLREIIVKPASLPIPTPFEAPVLPAPSVEPEREVVPA